MADRIIEIGLVVALTIPLLVTVLFLSKYLLGRVTNSFQYFESPFKARRFNFIVSKAAAFLLLLIAAFLVFFLVTSSCFDSEILPFPWNLVGLLLFVVYWGCFVGFVFGLGKAVGAGASSKLVFDEVVDIFRKKNRETGSDAENHNSRLK